MPPGERWWVVLADFGISKKAEESNGPTTAIQGTTAFMAPELLGYLDKIEPRSIADFKAADMWALGEILFQMLTSEATFRKPPDLVKYCSGQKQFPSDRLPTSATEEGRDFINSIMAALPRERKNTTQCIQHRWMGLLRVEEELTTLNLEQNSPQQSKLPMSETSSNELASALWTSTSKFQDETATQATVQVTTEMPLHLHRSSTEQTQLQLTPNDSSIQYNTNDEKKPIISATATLIQNLQAYRYTNGVHCVDFSPDSRWLAIASSGGLEGLKVQLWSTESGMLAHTFTDCSVHWSLYPVLRFSQDSTRLIVTDYDKLPVRVWSTKFGTPVETGDIPEPGRSFDFSFDRNWVVIICKRSLFIWSTEPGVPAWTIRDYPTMHRHTLSPDNRWLAIAFGNDLPPQLWSTESRKPVQTFKDCFDRNSDEVTRVYWLKFSPDGRWLAIAGSRENGDIVWLWSTESETLVQMHDSYYSVSDFTFSPDSRWLVTDFGIRSEGVVGIFSTESRKMVLTIYVYIANQPCLFSPDSRWLVIASNRNRSPLYLWSTESWTVVQTFKSYPPKRDYENIIHFTFSPDSGWLATSSDYSTIQLWSTESRTLRPKFKAYRCPFTSFDFSPDSQWLVIYSRFTGEIWHVETAKLVDVVDSGETGQLLINFSPDCRWLVTANREHPTIRLWSLW